MANASPCMPSGPMGQVFFSPGASSLHGSPAVTPLPVASVSPQGGFNVMDFTHGLGASGGATMPPGSPAPSGVSFSIQIGLTRESVLMPQSADLAYVKQIACSIVDTKVNTRTHMHISLYTSKIITSQETPKHH